MGAIVGARAALGGVLGPRVHGVGGDAEPGGDGGGVRGVGGGHRGGADADGESQRVSARAEAALGGVPEQILPRRRVQVRAVRLCRDLKG